MRKRIGVIAGEITHGLAYQRGHLFFRLLQDEFEFIPMSMSEVDHVKMLYLDGLIMLHPSYKEQAQIIKRARAQYQIPVIVDLDDLLTDLPSDHPSFDLFKDNSVSEILMLSNHVVVSTEYLRKAWGHFNRSISVVENCIDENRYKSMIDSPSFSAPKAYHSGFVVGWTGGQSHRSDLLFTGFIDGLIQFMDKYDDVRAYFHILCPQVLLDKFGVRVIFNEKAVDYMDWPSLTYTFPMDLCCVPLQDHPFNHAKSDLRLLDMAPFKIPVMASPRENFMKHVAREYVTLAEDHHWFNALEAAYLNKRALKDQGQRAHDYVLTERTAPIGAEKWRKIIRQVLQEFRP